MNTQLNEIRSLAQVTTAALTHGHEFLPRVDVDDPDLAQRLHQHLTNETRSLAAKGTPVTCGMLNHIIWNWHHNQITNLLNTHLILSMKKIHDLTLIYGCEFHDVWDHLQESPSDTKDFKALLQEFQDTKEGWIADRQDDDPRVQDEHDFREWHMEEHRQLLDQWHDENFPEIPTHERNVEDEDLAAEIHDILTNLEAGTLK